MMPTHAQLRAEKAAMEERIRKVRQVVPTSISKNDVILALHNHDLDVERTIQAFCEDAKSALGDWENTSKPKKKKAPRKEAEPKEAVEQQQHRNGHSNGYAKTPVVASSSSSASATSQAAKRAPVPPPQAATAAGLQRLDALQGAAKGHAVGREVAVYKQDFEAAQKQWSAEAGAAERLLEQCFREVRQAAERRERLLLAELRQLQADGARHFAERRAALDALVRAGENASPADLKKFYAGKQVDAELAAAGRFAYDNGKAIRAVSTLGEVVGAIGTRGAAIKHATSHSSLVSSVGEDSGLGQISPVANEKPAPVKLSAPAPAPVPTVPVNQVENGGIRIQSESLSVDQLDEITRRFQETLKQRGVDPAILSASGTSAPRRRPPPSKKSAPGNATNGGGSGKSSKKNGVARHIEVSI